RDLDDYWSFLTDVAGAIAVAIDALDADQRERVRDAIGERLAARGAIDLPAVSLVVSARADRRQPVPET
ncbi:MAG TPA: hypothetical protein VFU21_01230, partial [Kofleriaceae bacterium]|nr:hypothetical protein [Kofleriaceae bacterium]